MSEKREKLTTTLSEEDVESIRHRLTEQVRTTVSTYYASPF